MDDKQGEGTAKKRKTKRKRMTTMATNTADTAISATKTMMKSSMFTVIHKTATKRKETMQKNAGNTTTCTTKTKKKRTKVTKKDRGGKRRRRRGGTEGRGQGRQTQETSYYAVDQPLHPRQATTH